MPGPIDILTSLPVSPEERAKSHMAAEGELECKMSAAIKRMEATGVATRKTDLESVINNMDEAGVDMIMAHTWKMFSYHNRRMLSETPFKDVIAAVNKYPKRIVGVHSYNPYRIQQSLQEIRMLVRDYNFKSIYMHIYGFDMYLTDARMYPVYALCEELQIPVMMQVGHVLEAMPSKYGDPMQLDELVLHFPTLKLVGVHNGFPYHDALISCCMKWDNIYMGVTAWMPRYLPPSVVTFINGNGRDQCMWGTNGLPFKPMFEQFNELGLKPANKENLLWKTAAKVFNLDGA